MTRRSRRVSPATVFFALLSVALGIALYVRSRPPTVPPPRAPHPAARSTPSRPPRAIPTAAARTRTRAVRTEPEPAPAFSGTPRVAIVIDDLGNELEPAERIARWKPQVAGAVLPGLAWSAASARALSEGGKEVLLHLPMEPAGYPRVRPGPGVVLRSQSDAEIAATLERDLESVPGASGVNNHMGSAATADPRVMRAVAGVLSRRGLYFLDSRTTDATVAAQAAGEAAVPAVSRRVFLDDVRTEDAVRAQLSELLRRARREGSAVAIGHPYPATLRVLEIELPGLAEKGIVLVRVGELVK